MYYKFEKRSTPFFATANLTMLSPIPHIHNHLELVYLFEGQSNTTADDKKVPLHAGDLYLSFPNQIHFYDGAIVKGVLIIVSPDLFPDLIDIFRNKLPQNPIIKKDHLPCDVREQLQRICECVNSPEKLHQLAANGYMQGLLAELILQMRLSDVENDHDSVRDILVYCLEKYKEPLSLDTLSSELHLSKYHISHIFTDRLNISFPDFINGLRIESACRRLDKGRDITEIAFESGFNSIRSFNRNFKRNIGMTPTEYIHHKKLQTY